MHRRWGGLLIIMVVVIAAVVVPSVLGRQLAGMAVADPVPDPPHVGDCLTTPADQPRSPWTAGIAPCAAGRFGEVVAVTVDPGLAPASSRRQPDGDDAVGADGERQSCGDEVLRYLGLTVGPDHQGVLQSYWQPLAPLDMSIQRPSARQLAAGQHWLACAFFVHDHTGKSASYRNSARDAYGLGMPPAALAYCLTTADLTKGESVPCNEPHNAEAFGGTSTARAGLTAESLNSSCALLASRLTRMPDPTAGGTLRVQAATVHSPTGTTQPGLGDPTDITGFAACVITAPSGRPLDGSLLALGARPVPWAG